MSLALTHARYLIIENLRVPISVIGSGLFPSLSLLFFVVPFGYPPEVATVAAGLEAKNAQLKGENERLVKERDDLAGQLDGALSSVAQITKTARGVVVNLPDILFDVNKATLKQNTQVALAKLAGIVQVFPRINLRIEGYTDSTGSDELNMRLSRERADAVMSFLQAQGVAASRMTDQGYCPKFPVADNATVEGRAKNRRVEIVLAEGVIKGAGN